MQESLAAEHGRELLGDALEQLLDSGVVADEGGRHLEAARGDVADGGLHVVRDPLDEVAAVLVLHVQHLLVDFLHRHSTAEHHRHGQIAAVSRVARRHHVLCVKHLMSELRHGQGAVLLTATRGEGSEAGHEEVETWEWHHVDGQLPQIGVQLTREPQTRGDTRHRRRHQMVEVTVRGRRQLQGAEADVVQSLVIDAVALVSVLDQLMYGECGVVRLHDRVRHLQTPAHNVQLRANKTKIR